MYAVRAVGGGEVLPTSVPFAVREELFEIW